MIVNQSILPFYPNRAYQHQNFRWYAQRNVGPMTVPAGYLPTLQLIRTTNLGAALTVTLRNVKTGAETDISSEMAGTGLVIDQTYSYDIILYSATLPISVTDVGEYELTITDGVNTVYSDYWGMSSRTNEMIKLTYWHLEDFPFDQDSNGTTYKIRYAAPFKNTVYIKGELFKPNYPYYREVEERLGRNFDRLHISAKEYFFPMYCTEDVLDALRLVPLHDRKTIEYKGRTYVVDELLMEPEWQDHGDIALVRVTFRSNTVAVVAGRSSAAVYGPEGLVCVPQDFACVATLVAGSDDYLNFRYTDASGVVQQLQDDDLIIKNDGGTYTVEYYAASAYTPQVVPAGFVARSSADSTYYQGIGSNRVALPQIQFYDYGSGQIAGTFLTGATHQIYYVAGGIEVLIGNYSYDDLAVTGVFVTLPDEAEFLRMRIASGLCGIFQNTTDYELPEPPTGSQGIGFDVIESTLIVY